MVGRDRFREGSWLAYASIPDANGVIHACWQNVSSANKPVKLLNTSQKATCPSGWVAVNWNKAGPAGQQGSQGPAGVSGYITATTTVNFSPQSGNLATNAASCPEGRVPIGGGFNVSGVQIPRDWGVVEDRPIFTRDANGNVIGGGWQASLSSVATPSPGSGTLSVYAVCATAS
jgi:hypothetical protein